ncbi:glycosyl transferase family 41-domain-containing protein [Lyophyllum atratum]|nr:glycosyl transferase family 41-domain-containing protein [Lyophyllum atratum]
MEPSRSLRQERAITSASHGHPNADQNFSANPGTFIAINRSAESQSLPSISNIEVETPDLSSGLHIFQNDPTTGRLLPPSHPQATSDLESRLQALRRASEEPGSSQFNPLTSTLGRDVLLSYAQRDYLALDNSKPNRPTPVPIHQSNVGHSLGREGSIRALLTILKTFHPTHIPTLLLLGCMQFSLGEMTSSLEINQDILRLDPTYVEAMCNIGCIMKSLDKRKAAHDWWWKALRLQPMYWDVMDHLLDLILEGQPSGQSDSATIYREALKVCEFVQSSLVDEAGRIRKQVPVEQVSRIQNIYYTQANILQMSAERYLGQALDSYSHAIDLALVTRPNVDAEQVTFRDLITATCISGLFLMEQSRVPQKVLHMLGFDIKLDLRRPGFSILNTVHRLGNRLIAVFHETNFDVLPLMLLEPEQIEQLPRLILASSLGVLPSNCSRDSSSNLVLLPAHVRDVTNKVSSRIILMIAKRFQDSLGGANLADGTFQSYRISRSLVLILYYLALALFPSAIAYNNLGAVISTLSLSVVLKHDGQRRTVGTEHFTTAFYRRGLQLDPTHAHLLTNLGSALKERGEVSDAIRLYAQAIAKDPELDVALINLGNALRDAGRPWESIKYYRRALDLKPIPDATCGLATTLSAICDWRGRGWLEPELGMVQSSLTSIRHVEPQPGWIHDLIATCEQQLSVVYAQNVGLLQRVYTLQEWMDKIQSVYDRPLSRQQWERWERSLRLFYTEFDRVEHGVNEGGYVLRLVEWLSRGLQRKWYVESYGTVLRSEHQEDHRSRVQQDIFSRPIVPSIAHFPVPALLPFHTFSFPLDPRTIRLISHRNALRISYKTLTQPWLPKHVYPPPPPPYKGRLNIGYVSYDFTDHPLAHLVQSIFRFHDPEKFNVHVYATSPDDGSSYRRKISRDSYIFLDVSSWKPDTIVNRIVEDQIHILINLGGFTFGSKNEIFAARPCPVQIVMMGFPGPLGAGWSDYLVGDVTSCAKEMQAEPVLDDTEDRLYVGAEPDPESKSGDWTFTEKMIYMPHTFMVTDHKQSYSLPHVTFEVEQDGRAQKRRAIFPDLAPDIFIFANFNQLYKIDPVIFAAWLSILRQVPRSILWLLRFPAAGEQHLKRTAKAWANDEVASRIRFTDVAAKEEHIRRGGVVDLFLDTAECNAHTVAADVLWSGTPILTWPKHHHKMCSRIGASIAKATGFGDKMVVPSIEEYKERAVFLAIQQQTVEEDVESELTSLRRDLHRTRDTMPLFDTQNWTRNFEKACWAAWERWVAGVDLSDTKSGYKSSILITDDGEVES